MCEYPTKMLRGLSNISFIIEGFVSAEAFNFDPVREDGFCELSITWFDGQDAVDTIMNQRRTDNGKIQFIAGAAELDRQLLREVMGAYFISKLLDYERRPTSNNQYHGNILLKNTIDKSLRKHIKFGLATIASNHIIPNPYID